MFLALAIIALGCCIMMFIKDSSMEIRNYLTSIKDDWGSESHEELDHLIKMVEISYANRARQFLFAAFITMIAGILDLCIRCTFALPATWTEGLFQILSGIFIGMFIWGITSFIFVLTNRQDRKHLLTGFRSAIWNRPLLMQAYEQLVGRAPAIHELLEELHPLSYKHLR